MQAASHLQPVLPVDQERYEAAQRAFNAALAAFQAEVGAAKRDGRNPHFRTTYATLASVIEAVKPASKHGLSHTQTCLRDGDQVLLVTSLRHAEGFELLSELPLTIGNDWQRFGSAFTYARRFALMGIYGIASADDPADDDGDSASNPAPKKSPATGKTAEPSPLELRAQAVTQALTALHEADPDAIKPLVEGYRTAFKVPAKTPVARSFDQPERLAWFEERLGLLATETPSPDAPTP